jgi:hypothetical protein
MNTITNKPVSLLDSLIDLVGENEEHPLGLH